MSSGRYDRQVVLAGFGTAGQRKLAEASVLVVGAGGLGSPALLYLAASGVGKLGIADGDDVSLSNLQRQVLYATADVGADKTATAAARLAALNPEISIQTHAFFVTAANADALVALYDVIIDATDNFAARYLLDDACLRAGKPLVQGSVSRFEGQLAIFGDRNGHRASYRDLFASIKPGSVPDCAEAGVLGVLPGIIGIMQAAETIKLIAGIGEPSLNTLSTYNLLTNAWNRFELPVRPVENVLANQASPPSYADIGPAEFYRLADDPNVTVIDVREPGEQPEATGFKFIRIPMAEFAVRANDFQGRVLILFCHSGVRSALAADLVPPGNTVYNLKGGIVKLLRFSPSSA